MSSDNLCPCCNAALAPGLRDWHRQCRACGYEAGELSLAINSAEHPVQPDEVEREAGLRSVRLNNFARLIDVLRQHLSAEQPRVLDVGCAHGLFLGALPAAFEAEGIEPHQAVASYAQGKGLKVREGYFPAVLGADERFDVIVFNDVFEHIPDPGTVLQACREALNPGGLLLLNLPDAGGVFYRVSKLMARLGLAGVFERMWQLKYPSPHLHFFKRDNLQACVEGQGFSRLACGRLQTLTVDGLYPRIAHTGEYHFPVAQFLYLGALATVPLLSVLPADIQWQLFQRDKLP